MDKLTTAQKTLVRLNEEASTFAKHEVETTDELNPFMVLLLKNGDFGFADVSLLFNKDMEEMKRFWLQYLLKETKAIAFILASEAWIAGYTEKQMEDYGTDRARRPCEREDRREVLLLSSEHIEGDWTMAVFEIHRDDNNKRTVDLTKPEQAETGKGSNKNHRGALTNLFKGI